MMSKAARKRELIEALERNDRLCCKALTAIYAQQSEEEQEDGMTIFKNGVGFSSRDDVIGSSLAEQILAGRSMSSKQMPIVRKFAKRYSGQLVGLIDREKEGAI